MPVDERVARSVALEQAYVHDVYEKFSNNHIEKPWPKVQQFLENLEPGSVVCDVGCGNGKYFNLNTSVFNIGGDKCASLCEVAREKENEVLVLDNLTLPFRDESLDAVLSIAVIHHLATTERRVCALRELARVLRIGGRLIISVWAMEQQHRKFESQDVLVPWHHPRHLSSPSLELTSNTSEEDYPPPYHAYTQSDTDSSRSTRGKGGSKKKGKRHRGRSIDPGCNSSPSSSSLSSPNETCYSFVRRAIQKLAGGKRVNVHKPWFLESWSNCARETTQTRYEPDGCDCCENDDIQDLPIELRRIDDEEVPQRRQTFPASQIINDLYANLKSRSMTNIKTVENNNVKEIKSEVAEDVVDVQEISVKSKPRLVKQKKSINEEDEEDLDKPTDMKTMVGNLPDFKIFHGSYHRGSVFKQRSMNEELMSSERLIEKEQVRQNIQKQASLNEDLIYQHHESLKDSFFTSKRFQLIKTGFTNKIRNSTTNIERVTSSSLKNGFVRIFQNWKSSEATSPTTITEEDPSTMKKLTLIEDKPNQPEERRHSKEDGSDSSKDSSLQSDTSVDSEDSFASVIYIPKSDPMSPTPPSPGPTSPRVLKTPSSVPNSPRIKQSSCPTSPRIKQMPLTVYPLTKQLSFPKPRSPTEKRPQERSLGERKIGKSLAQKYAVVQIPEFKRTSLNSGEVAEEKVDSGRAERLKKIKELLSSRPGFGIRSNKGSFPIVRHSSMSNGKMEPLARPLPKLLSLELFNPETDDKDSDSSAVSSPDSVDSVISVEEKKFSFSGKDKRSMSLLEAAADVASSLDSAVEKVIKSSPKARRRELKPKDIKFVIERRYSSDTTPLLAPEIEPTWNDECHKHLTDFADQLSEKLLKEIDYYQERRQKSTSMEQIDDPYITRLSEELQHLSKLSAEIQKQNEYLAKLSASDEIFSNQCVQCGSSICRCKKRKSVNEIRDYKNVSKKMTELKKDKMALSDCNLKTALKTEESTLSLDSNNHENKPTIRLGTSTDSCDSEKGSTNSMMSSVTTSLNGQSLESADGSSERGSGDSHKDTNSVSHYSDGGSTASLASCPDWKTIKNRFSDEHLVDLEKKRDKSSLNPLVSDMSQESLPSDNMGGEITYHRYYHVFREGELDQLIEKYVENLHIISSYYDHASWCVVAEKVQVWTI